MKPSPLNISSLPAWSKLNGVTWHNSVVQPVASAGYGVAAARALSSTVEEAQDAALLRVPAQLVLGKEAVEEFAKVDGGFREVWEVAGGKSTRGDVMLFLIMQSTLAAGHDVGVRSPWTEYVRLLPETVPLPTMWTAEQREYLIGTSLEPALDAKMAALTREFDQLREQTQSIPWCAKIWWETESLTLSDWILADAWYRSRSLELPQSGEAMVPCLDMANHSAAPTAYYEQTDDGDVLLLLRPEQTVSADDEITISYGTDKSAAEMFFSYGFIPSPLSSSTSSLTLPLLPPIDDPLARAKLACYPHPPTLHIISSTVSSSSSSSTPAMPTITAPFAYLLALNQEDGLDFKTLQETATDGSTTRALRTFWQDVDVSDRTASFENLIATHPLHEVFALRVGALLAARVAEQMQRLMASEGLLVVGEEEERTGGVWESARVLRGSEVEVLRRVKVILEEQNAQLLTSPVVLAYLAHMNGDRGEHDHDSSNDGAAEFS